jgi:FixJ family two-component response regulator
MGEPTIFVLGQSPGLLAAVRDVADALDLPCDAFPSPEDFLQAYDPSRPGCLIMELPAPGVRELNFHKNLPLKGITLPAIFVSSSSAVDVSIAVQAMRDGAVHFFEQPIHPFELLKTIGEAMAADENRRAAQESLRATEKRLGILSPRQEQILVLLGRGQSSAEIAEELEIGVRTVLGHQDRLMKKLGIGSQSELLEFAVLAAKIRQDLRGTRPDNDMA